MSTKKHPCAKHVFSGARHDIGGHPCCFSGVVAEDGEWWCKKHAPSAVVAKEAAWQAKFDAENAAKHAKWTAEWEWKQRAKQCLQACDGMADPVAEVARLRTAVRELEQKVAQMAVVPPGRKEP